MTAFWLLMGLVGSSFAEQPPVRDASLGALPADMWRDAVALPTTDNALWLLSGAVLTLAVHEIEDPAATADVIAYNLVREPRLKQQILEMPQLLSRLRMLLAYCSERIGEADEN